MASTRHGRPSSTLGLTRPKTDTKHTNSSHQKSGSLPGKMEAEGGAEVSVSARSAAAAELMAKGICPVKKEFIVFKKDTDDVPKAEVITS